MAALIHLLHFLSSHDRTRSLSSCFHARRKSLLLPDLVGEKSSRIQGEGLEGKEGANRGFREGKTGGRMDEGWLELSVSSRSCLSSSILAALTHSLPSRTACKPGWFIFLTYTDTGSTARSRHACRAGRGQNEESFKPSLNPQIGLRWAPAKYPQFLLFYFASRISS